MKKIIFACLALLCVIHARAQFDIEYQDGHTTQTAGNIFVYGQDNSWDINETDASQIKSIKRHARSADTPIELTNSVGNIYFGDFWKEGYADYYFILTNDRVGKNANGDPVPMHNGGYILYVDIWSAVSADHKNAILPEGTYTFSPGRKNGCFTQEFSVLTVNKGKEGTGYRIVDHQLVGGEMVVKHVDQGYDFIATVQTKDGQTFKFHYNGEIAFDDQSGIEDKPDNKFITADVDIKPLSGQYLLYAKTNIDNYVIRLFDVDGISADGVHPMEPGMKLHLDLFAAKGAGFEGTYKAGTKTGQYTIRQEPGVFFPGTYTAGIPLGSHVERVNADYSVSHCGIVDGTVTITKVDDTNYHVVANLVSDQGKAVTCDWTGPIPAF